jgi:hypothetical protein
LAGFLLKWDYIYKAIPPSDSWIWRWFPDGEQWKKGMKRMIGRNLTVPLLVNAALEEAGIVSGHKEMKKEI